jgi:hypothetical protein
LPVATESELGTPGNVCQLPMIGCRGKLTFGLVSSPLATAADGYFWQTPSA